jgi:acetylornithine deacetylase/succinyl-diaminopimelate desuccinylase-like protein
LRSFSTEKRPLAFSLLENPNNLMEQILRTIDDTLPASLERLFALLRIPSISAQPAHAADCRAAAEWARQTLEDMGFTARLSETAGLPGVVATHHAAGPDAPHVLFYGHYDVQPADPLELWDSDPFEPQLVEGPRGKRIVARGAVDDKGQVVSFFEACRAHLAVNGRLPVRLTVLLEGEEECGSPSLAQLLTQERENLAADFVLVADTNMWNFHLSAGPRRGGGYGAWAVAGSAFGPVRRDCAEPDQRAHPRAGRDARCTWRDPNSRVL